MSLIRMLNAGFGEPLGHELPALRDLGVQGIRTDNQKNDADTTLARTQEITDAGLVPLIVVAGLAQLDLLPAGTNVEWRNEPDLEGPKASEYAKQVELFAAACEAKGLQGWAGVISNLNGRGFKYFDDARIREWSHTINVSIHRYPNGDGPETPHDGFRSRDHEVEALRSRIGSRRFGVTETGYHTAGRKSGAFGGKKHWTDDEVAAHIAWELAFWERVGAEICAIYQLNDGPSNTPIDRYGIRRTDGTWKPAAATFKVNA